MSRRTLDVIMNCDTIQVEEGGFSSLLPETQMGGFVVFLQKSPMGQRKLINLDMRGFRWGVGAIDPKKVGLLPQRKLISKSEGEDVYEKLQI